jgi:spore coat protein CotF
MTEQDLLSDLVNQEKQIIAACTETLQEAAEPQLRRLLLAQFEQGNRDHYELRDHIRSKGYQQDMTVSGPELRQAVAEIKNMQGGV